MDEFVAMNWQADHKYIDYLSNRYNRWIAGKGKDYRNLDTKANYMFH